MTDDLTRIEVDQLLPAFAVEALAGTHDAGVDGAMADAQ